MSTELLSLIGILLGLAVLIILAFKGHNATIITIAATLVVVIFSKEDLFTVLTEQYMGGLVGFMKPYFLVLFVSAIFASLMQYTGAMQTIGFWLTGLMYKYVPQKYMKFAAVVIIGVILTALLTYGGVNVFVMAFLAYPLARTVFEELDIPWHLVFCGTLGSATFTMGYLPGSPQLVNLTPTTYLGTTPTAGPVLGIIATFITLIMSMFYIWHVVKKAEERGEHFIDTGAEVAKAMPRLDIAKDIKTFDVIRSVLPSLTMIVLMLMNVNVIVALLVAILLLIIFYFPTLRKVNISKMLTDGTNNAISAAVSVSCIIAFGAVVQNSPGYAYVTSLLTSIPVNPLIQYLIAVEVAAGICGSATGGLGVALGSFGDYYLGLGLNAQAMHRLGAIAACGLDSLPHTSGIFVSLSISKLTHAQAYKHQFWLTVIIPVITAIIVTALYMATGIL